MNNASWSRMAIFRFIKIIIAKNSKSKTRPYFTATATANNAALFLTPPFCTHLSHRPPFSKWIAPFQGPLFLSSPPWKLSQSATPLNGVVLRKVQALNFDLIRGHTNLPSTLGFPRPNVVDRVGSKEEVERHGLVKSFVNLPNLVSMSRLVSGPFIAWYFVSFCLECIIIVFFLKISFDFAVVFWGWSIVLYVSFGCCKKDKKWKK